MLDSQRHVHVAGEQRAFSRADATGAGAEPTVYVIDDEPSMRESIAALLDVAGYRVEVFASALDFHPPLPVRPACVVLDLFMPELSGAELQQRLLLGPDPLPMIFISGQGDVSAAVESMKAGAVDFLAKPFEADALLSAVERALSHDRAAVADRLEGDRLRASVDRLTTREREVLFHVTRGLLNKQVGARLGITERTVKRHRSAIMQKLNAGSLAELVRLVDSVGLAEPPQV
jgi:FixJ family two-component response regulator